MALVATTSEPPSWEDAVTTVAICPAFSGPTCFVHFDKLLWTQILHSMGFYSGGGRQKGHVKRKLKTQGSLWNTCGVDGNASGVGYVRVSGKEGRQDSAWRASRGQKRHRQEAKDKAHPRIGVRTCPSIQVAEAALEVGEAGGQDAWTSKAKEGQAAEK